MTKTNNKWIYCMDEIRGELVCCPECKVTFPRYFTQFYYCPMCGELLRNDDERFEKWAYQKASTVDATSYLNNLDDNADK